MAKPKRVKAEVVEAKPAARRTQALVRGVITDGGILPIEVMIENMRWWYAEAEKARFRIERLMKMQGFTNGDMSAEQITELVEALKLLDKWRDKAQDCAVDAAPYIHPRLGNLTVKGDMDNPLIVQHKVEEARHDIAGRIARLASSSEEDEVIEHAVN